jgi:hypothetical protein
MTSLESELALIGDHLQAAWRADARHARRRRRALLAAGLAALLAITGAGIASDIFPVSLTKSDSKPPAAALSDLRATYRPANRLLKPWQKALDLDLSKAIMIARVTSRETGPLSIIVVPAKRGICIDAARPDGSSYLSGCDQQPTRQQQLAPFPPVGREVTPPQVAPPDDSRGLYVTVEARKRNGVTQPPLGLWVINAPPHAARIDVRRRDASHLPAVISHGWLVFLNPRPGGAAVLVRVYDKAGKRLVSYYA